MSQDIAIHVENVSKDFRLPHERLTSVKSRLVKLFDKSHRTVELQHVLKDISFEVYKGEFLGIIGRNGSGKSTLLKIISGIYLPNKGKVHVNGRLVPFIELGVGFNPELTGRENIYLNGALLGFSTKQIEAMYDDIVAFAELHEFMDQKLKNYSSGMQVRLAFSVAIKAQGDILVLDEVLAVGDEAFQRKCNDYFYKAKREGKTIILVTHSMENIRQFCNRAILIEAGEIKSSGNSDKVASQYSNLFVQDNEPKTAVEAQEAVHEHNWPVKLKKISTLQHSRETNRIQFKEDFEVKLSLKSNRNYDKARLAFDFIDQSGMVVVSVNTDDFGQFSLASGHNSIHFVLQNVFSNGEYYINMAVRDLESNEQIYKEPEVHYFSVVGAKMPRYGIAHPKITMNIDEKAGATS